MWIMHYRLGNKKPAQMEIFTDASGEAEPQSGPCYRRQEGKTRE